MYYDQSINIGDGNELKNSNIKNGAENGKK